MKFCKVRLVVIDCTQRLINFRVITITFISFNRTFLPTLYRFYYTYWIVIITPRVIIFVYYFVLVKYSTTDKSKRRSQWLFFFFCNNNETSAIHQFSRLPLDIVLWKSCRWKQYEWNAAARNKFHVLLFSLRPIRENWLLIIPHRRNDLLASESKCSMPRK